MPRIRSELGGPASSGTTGEPSRSNGGVTIEAPAATAGQTVTVSMVLRKQIKMIPLIGIIYFSVSGGPYGLEDAVSSSGPGMTLLALLLVPVIYAVPVSLMTAELSCALPLEGGYYQWVKIALGRFPGFLEGIWSWLDTFLDTALYPIIFADYLAQWVPWVHRGHVVLFSLFGGGFSIDSHWMVAVAFMIPLTLLNIRGSRLVGETSVLLMVLVLLPFVIVSVIGLIKLADSNLGHVLGPFTLHGQSAPASFGAGLAVIVWNYDGWDSPSTVLEEIDQPGRTYTRALLISVVLITISYLLPMLGALGSGLHAGHPGAWTDGDFANAGGLLTGYWLKLAITIAAVIAQIGLFSSLLMSGSRLPRTLAADRMLPQFLARDGRHGTPTAAIVVSVVVFAVFCALNFVTLIDSDLIVELASIVLELAAFLVLRHTAKNLPRSFRAPGGWIGAILIVLAPTAVFAYLLESTIADEPGAFWIGMVILAVGVALYPVCSHFFKQDHPDAPLELPGGVTVPREPAWRDRLSRLVGGADEDRQ